MMSEIIQNRNQKMDIIMDVIHNIKNGKKVKEIFDANQELIQSITPMDVFSIPAFKKESDFLDEEIIQMASKLMNLFHTALENYNWDKERTSDYVKLHLQEAKHIVSQMDRLKGFFKKQDWFLQKEELSQFLINLQEIEQVFLKSQNILYPRLEKVLENDRPLQIMWTLQDHVKRNLKVLQEGVFSLEKEEWIKQMGQFFFLSRNVLDRERLLVLPIAASFIKENEWVEMLEEAIEIGTILPDADFSFKKQANKSLMKDTKDPFLENLYLILDQLTVDITFVDAQDEVCYFNNTKDRLFVRSKSVLGRKVQNCHPKSSMHVVEEILNRFKRKEQSEAEFYIQMKEKMLYILYRAIYDESGTYKGTLEITQDVTHIRSLEGEKRLLEEKEV